MSDMDDAHSPEIPTARLHLIGAATRRALEAALVELAARYLACGERVLVVEGGRRLGLPAWFGADGGPGLIECLEGRLPLLGLVQSGGVPGLYLLAHGEGVSGARWTHLGRLLDAAWSRFGRVLIVVGPEAPAAAGDALRGRLVRAWWSGPPGALPRAALALSRRLGIWFERIDLDRHADATLEALAKRVPAIRACLPEGFEEPGAMPDPRGDRPEPAPVPGNEVLACNLQVRERLRFLIWMRGIQSRSRRTALAPASQA